jgi:hypothetical protein
MTEWTVNGFREHDGNGMPVDGETRVVVRLRESSGMLAERIPFPAVEFTAIHGNDDWWIHRDEWNDIVAYKEMPK